MGMCLQTAPLSSQFPSNVCDVGPTNKIGWIYSVGTKAAKGFVAQVQTSKIVKCSSVNCSNCSQLRTYQVV